jgi:glycosyltransferase involved in cell wall biosynthesis
MGSAGSPKVSVIIPVFNVTKYITEALDSLRAQTFRDFETILVNDGCPDTGNLEAALEPYRDEITYIKSGKWASISSSRNTGILASTAPYVALLDGDDAWYPEYLSVHVGMLEANPGIDLVYGNYEYFGDSPWAGGFGMDRIPSNGEVNLRSLISRECNVFISVTARREALIRAGLFDPDVRGGEDLDLWIRLVRTGGGIVYHRQPLARYRLRLNSMSDDKLDLLNNGLTVYEKHLKIPEISADERGWIETAIRKQHATIDFVKGRKALYAGNFAEARERLSRAAQILKMPKLRLAVVALHIAPRLLHRYIHHRYPTEYAFLH